MAKLSGRGVRRSLVALIALAASAGCADEVYDWSSCETGRCDEANPVGQARVPALLINDLEVLAQLEQCGERFPL